MIMVGRARRMERLAKKTRREPKPNKLNEVDSIAEELNRSGVIAVLSMYKLPAAALQKVKRDLDGKVNVRFAKKSALAFSLEKAGKKELEQYLGNHPALLLTDMNPFKLYKFLQTNKSTAPAKAGDIAPKDIEVKSGPTDLMPGPAITTLTKVGIPAKVEAGKIAVMKDKVVCKTGDKVSADLAAALQLLKIEPMEIGLNLVIAAEGKLIYKPDVLAIDETKVLADLMLAVSHAVNLSVSSGWPTKQTMPIMITKAFMNAKAVGLEGKVLDKGIIEDLLAKAKLQADALNAKIK
jgi:large subunit ribosomal protein L10